MFVLFGLIAIDVSFCAWPRPWRSGSVRFRQFWLTLMFELRFVAQSPLPRGKYWSGRFVLPLSLLFFPSSNAAKPEISRSCSSFISSSIPRRPPVAFWTLATPPPPPTSANAVTRAAMARKTPKSLFISPPLSRRRLSTPVRRASCVLMSKNANSRFYIERWAYDVVVRLILAAIAVAALAAPAAASGPSPALRLTALQPLRVKGIHFRSREHVRVTYFGAVRRTRVVRARADGSFRVGFVDAAADPCSSFSFFAGASHGCSAAHTGTMGPRVTRPRRPLELVAAPADETATAAARAARRRISP